MLYGLCKTSILHNSFCLYPLCLRFVDLHYLEVEIECACKLTEVMAFLFLNLSYFDEDCASLIQLMHSTSVLLEGTQMYTFFFFIYSLLPTEMRKRFLSALWTMNPNFQMPDIDKRVALIGSLFIPDMRPNEDVKAYCKRLRSSVWSNFIGKSFSAIKANLLNILKRVPGIVINEKEIDSVVDVAFPDIRKTKERGAPFSDSDITDKRLKRVTKPDGPLGMGFTRWTYNLVLRMVTRMMQVYDQNYCIKTSRWSTVKVWTVVKRFALNDIMGRMFEEPLDAGDFIDLTDDELLNMWYVSLTLSNSFPSEMEPDMEACAWYLMAPRAKNRSIDKIQKGMKGRFSGRMPYTNWINFLLEFRDRNMIDKINEAGRVPAWMKAMIEGQGSDNLAVKVYDVLLSWLRNKVSSKMPYASSVAVEATTENMFDLYSEIIKLYREKQWSYDTDEVPYWGEGFPNVFTDDKEVVISYDLSSVQKILKSEQSKELKLDILNNSWEFAFSCEGAAREIIKDTQGHMMPDIIKVTDVEVSVKDVDELTEKEEYKFGIIQQYLDHVLHDALKHATEKGHPIIAELSEDGEIGAFSIAKLVKKVKKVVDSPIGQAALTVIPYGQLAKKTIDLAAKNKDILELADSVISKSAIAPSKKKVVAEKQPSESTESVESGQKQLSADDSKTESSSGLLDSVVNEAEELMDEFSSDSSSDESTD